MTARLTQFLRDHAPSAWPLWLGCAAALLAMALLLGPAAQWRALADEQLAAASLAQVAARKPVGATAQQAQPQQPLLLPEAARSPERSARLAQLARRHGVQVQRYREQWDALGQLQLSLTGRAPYAAWRSFTAAALAADPALALDRLRLQRADAADAALDADTQWTFLHRGAARAADSRTSDTRLRPGAAP